MPNDDIHFPRADNHQEATVSEELKLRTKRFAVRVLGFVDALPSTIKGRIIANQIGRSGTAVGANYRAACRARSRAEFIAKVGIVEEEADETSFWLELAEETGVVPTGRVELLRQESQELTAIMASSRITAQRNRVSPISR
jgi:four helix bundle protein